MKYQSFQIVIEKEPEDPGYYAYCTKLPGCYSNGSTIEETKKNIREAIALQVKSMRANKHLNVIIDSFIFMDANIFCFYYERVRNVFRRIIQLPSAK